MMDIDQGSLGMGSNITAQRIPKVQEKKVQEVTEDFDDDDDGQDLLSM